MADRILEGSLRAISAPDLLTFINMIKKTGILSLRQGERTRRVYWERGDMIFASSSDPDESLGSFLVRHGKITQEQNMKSGLLVEPGKRQGKVLVQMGVLTPKELWWAVKNQVLEIIYSTFALRDGYFTFEESEEPHEEKIKLSTSTTNIIMEGIRRLDEWPMIKELIPNDRLVPELAPVDQQDKGVRFLEGEKSVLALIDGRRTVREIIHRSALDEFETLRVFLSLVRARYAVLPEAPLPSHGEEVEDALAIQELIFSYNQIFSRILSSLAGSMSRESLEALAQSCLDTANSNILEGLRFEASGQLDPKVLTANVADHHVDRRLADLDGGLSTVLSFLLFEASKHLSPEEKSAIYRMVEERVSPAAS